MNTFYELVTGARSCRRFDESAPLAFSDLEALVECARLAPSAANQQVLRYMLVTAPAVRGQMCALLGWAAALKDWPGPMPGERPAGYILVVAPNEGANVDCDMGIAGQTIQLAAAAAGLGCCMLLNFNKVKMAELLGVAEDMRAAMVIGLGRPREERRLTNCPPDGSVRYWRDADGVHYVPKRSLEQLIIRYV